MLSFQSEFVAGQLINQTNWFKHTVYLQHIYFLVATPHLCCVSYFNHLHAHFHSRLSSTDYSLVCHVFPYLYKSGFRLLAICLFVCIATITPVDGRVVDETWLHWAWLLTVAALDAGEGLNSELWAPLSITKPAYFLNSTPPFKSSCILWIVNAELDKSNSDWHLASHFKGTSKHFQRLSVTVWILILRTS